MLKGYESCHLEQGNVFFTYIREFVYSDMSPYQRSHCIMSCKYIYMYLYILYVIVILYYLSNRKISALSTASSDPSLSSPPSLPSHLHLHPPPKRPLYNEPIMVQSDFVEMLQPRVVCFTCTNLVLGYLRLCLVSSQIHKGVVNKVWYYASNSNSTIN